MDFPPAEPLSRFGWWTNQIGGMSITRQQVDTFDSGGNLVDLSSGITFTANAGDFVAFAFSASVINEVELFQTGPMTIDDFAYARDNALPFTTSSTVPEPASWLLMAAGCASILILRRTIR